MDFTIIPATVYEKPEKITKFSQGFHHTLQTLPTWRESEIGGNGNNIRNFRKLLDTNQGGWGDPPLLMINHDFVHETIAEIKEYTKNSNATLNRAISTIKKVMTLCARSGYIQGVPVIEKLSETKRRRPARYSKDQVDRLVQIARERGDDAMAEAILLSAYSGLRQAECRRLHVDDIDWRNNVLLVGGTADTRTKGRNYREVPIHPRLESLLKSRTGLERGYHDIIFDEFPNQWNLHRRWVHVLKRMNVEDRTVTKDHYWKTLRNSFISWHLDGGTPSMKVKEWAGHSSITVTEGYYSYNTEQDHSLMAQV